MNNKRVSLFLAALLAVSALFSCGDTATQGGETTTQDGETTAEVKPE